MARRSGQKGHRGQEKKGVLCKQWYSNIKFAGTAILSTESTALLVS